MSIYGNSLSIMLEATSISSCTSMGIILYQHILKFIYQPNRRGASWINSINNEIKELEIGERNKNIKKVIFDPETQQSIYEKGRKEAIKETKGEIDSNVYPKILPSELRLELIINRKYLGMYLIKYANNEKIKELITNKILLNN